MSDKDEGLVGCGCMSIFLAANLLIGGFATDYSLWFILGKNIHWIGDVAIGLVAGEFTIPIMVICFILKMCGIESPLVH